MQECWVPFRELRNYFDLDDSAGLVISGFLRRKHFGHFFSFRYKSGRIEKFRETTPNYRIMKKISHAGAAGAKTTLTALLPYSISKQTQ